MFKLARDYGLALRVRERPLIERVQTQGLPCNDYDFLDSTSLHLEGDGKAAQFAQALRALPAGLSEWAVHPGLANAELIGMEADWSQTRQADFDFLMTADARQIIEQEGIVLLTYAALQRVWREK
jgi:hypothetical protein